ncbi:MAG: DUF2934 domain-containing protein [Halothiobacillus sp.]
MITATTTEKKSKIFPSNARSLKKGDGKFEESENLNEHIATAAYYKAEARGFSPGYEMEDWLEAEMEFKGSSESTH